MTYFLTIGDIVELYLDWPIQLWSHYKITDLPSSGGGGIMKHSKTFTEITLKDKTVVISPQKLIYDGSDGETVTFKTTLLDAPCQFFSVSIEDANAMQLEYTHVRVKESKKSIACKKRKEKMEKLVADARLRNTLEIIDTS